MRDETTVQASLFTQVAFGNSAPFTKSLAKPDETTTADAENFAMSLYNLIEYIFRTKFTLF